MRRLVAIGVAVLVLLVLVLAQLFLPGIAAQQLRDRLSKNGRVLSVQVSAFPAIELLWHDANKVVVRMASYSSGTGHLSSLLDDAGGVGTMRASATVLRAGLLTVHNATLLKRGNELTGTAQVTESDLRAAVPFIDNVKPVASSDGTLTLSGTGTLFGFTATVDATVAAQDGKLVVAPDVPFGGLVTVTLFDDPHVQVEGVSASPSSGGFSVSAQGRMQ
jgi:LmeA-like phospholipid-binding